MEGVALWQVMLVGGLTVGFFGISWGMQLFGTLREKRRPSKTTSKEAIKRLE
ncbi:MAG: hypothetical protein HYZ68_06690 [Chloroflexi bacterium]|nr:hypothetical protein [Chloroflexota bacterium]